MLLLLESLLDSRIDHVTMEFLFIIIILSTWIFSRGFQALQLIVIAVFGAVDNLFAYSVVKPNFKWQFVCKTLFLYLFI